MDVIDLGAGDADLAPPPAVVTALQTAVEKGTISQEKADEMMQRAMDAANNRNNRDNPRFRGGGPEAQRFNRRED